ncbi:MAG: hypothetical protein U0790_07025 [Isosphaeraceae bacterium]
MTNLFQVFTAVNGNVTVLPLSAPGVVSWFPTTRMLSDGGLLGVVGVSIGSSSPFLYDLNTATLSALVVPDGFATASLLQITNSGLIFGSVLTEDLRQGGSASGTWTDRSVDSSTFRMG